MQYINNKRANWKMSIESDHDGKLAGLDRSNIGMNSLSKIQSSSYPFADDGPLARESKLVEIMELVVGRRYSSQVGFLLLAKFFFNEITFIFSIDIANIAIKIIFIHALIFTTL